MNHPQSDTIYRPNHARAVLEAMRPNRSYRIRDARLALRESGPYRYAEGTVAAAIYGLVAEGLVRRIAPGVFVLCNNPPPARPDVWALKARKVRRLRVRRKSAAKMPDDLRPWLLGRLNRWKAVSARIIARERQVPAPIAENLLRSLVRDGLAVAEHPGWYLRAIDPFAD